MLRFDHAIITVQDLDAAMADFSAHGFTVLRGGVHASGATHNALIVFADGTYLELMARTGEPAKPGTADYSKWFPDGEGYAGVCLSSDDLDRDIAHIRARGIMVEHPDQGGRVRPDGFEMRWRTAMIAGAQLPFLIEDLTRRNLRVPSDLEATAHANSARGVAAFAVQRADAILLRRFDAVFGMPMNEGDGWTLYDCGGTRVRLESGGTRDVISSLTLSGLSGPLVLHGAVIEAGR